MNKGSKGKDEGRLRVQGGYRRIWVCYGEMVVWSREGSDNRSD